MSKSSVWWERAQEYRSLAQEASNPSKRASYLTLAENCGRVARRLEELEAIVAEGAQTVPVRAELDSP
jgi:hypothetical protein